MNPNETTEELPAEEAEDAPLELGGEWPRFFADCRWIDQEIWRDTFAAYAGEWIAVYHQEVVGHNRNLSQLRAEAERDRGVSWKQMAYEFIPDAKGTGVGRIWLA